MLEEEKIGHSFMEYWSDIGGKLKAHREAQKLTVEDVAHKTRIPAASIRAMEANYLSIFPSPAYARSFVKQYAGFLNCDAEDWLEQFHPANAVAESGVVQYLEPAIEKPSHTPPRTHRPIPQESSEESLLQPLIMLLITTAFIGGGIWAYFALENQLADTDAKPTSPTTEEPVEVPEEILEISPELVAEEEVEEEDEIPGFVFSDTDPPPKAIIVEEDEEEGVSLTPGPIAGD